MAKSQDFASHVPVSTAISGRAEPNSLFVLRREPFRPRPSSTTSLARPLRTQGYAAMAIAKT